MKLNWLDVSALVLVIVGGLNWGLIGLFDYDLISQLFGAFKSGAKIVYDLVGLAAIYLAFVTPKFNRG